MYAVLSGITTVRLLQCLFVLYVYICVTSHVVRLVQQQLDWSWYVYSLSSGTVVSLVKWPLYMCSGICMCFGVYIYAVVLQLDQCSGCCINVGKSAVEVVVLWLDQCTAHYMYVGMFTINVVILRLDQSQQQLYVCWYLQGYCTGTVVRLVYHHRCIYVDPCAVILMELWLHQ